MTVSNGTPGKPPAGPPPNGQNSAGGNGQHGKDRDEELATARTAGGQAGAAGTARPVTAAPTRTPVPGSARCSPPDQRSERQPGAAAHRRSDRSSSPAGTEQSLRAPPDGRAAAQRAAPDRARPAGSTGQPAPDTSAKKPGGAVPFWDSPQAAQPRQSLRERLGLGRKKTADEEPSGRPAVAPAAPAPTAPPPSATAGPAGAAAAGGAAAAATARTTMPPAPTEPNYPQPRSTPAPDGPADPDSAGGQARHRPVNGPNRSGRDQAGYAGGDQAGDAGRPRCWCSRCCWGGRGCCCGDHSRTADRAPAADGSGWLTDWLADEASDPRAGRPRRAHRFCDPGRGTALHPSGPRRADGRSVWSVDPDPAGRPRALPSRPPLRRPRTPWRPGRRSPAPLGVRARPGSGCRGSIRGR